MTERGGFEPPMPEGIHDFESCAINRTLPPLLEGFTIRHFYAPGKDRIAPRTHQPYYGQGLSSHQAEEQMNTRLIHSVSLSMIVSAILSMTAAVFAQDRPQPELGPPLKPLIKLIGFLNASPPKTTTYPLLTLAFPGGEKRYTFVLTDLRIMAGPLRTPGDILSEVKPYSTNFYIRASPDVVAQIASAAPTEQLTILAEYSRADRVLLVQNVEKKGTED